MGNAFDTEILRSITHSAGRFIAIALISALGCGFFAGLLMTSVDMDLSADEFYDGTNMSDLYVTGTLGLDDVDIATISQVEGVRSVEPVRMADAYAMCGGEKHVVRFNSLDLDAANASDTSDGMHAVSDDEGYINRPVLVEGSWPTGPQECVVAADAVLDEPIQVGDVIEAIDMPGGVDDVFAQKSWVVTGLVRSPYYLMTSNFGSSDLGSGEIDTFAFIAPDAFSSDQPYTGAFVTAQGAADELYPSDGYDSIVDALVSRLEGMSMELRSARLAAVQAEAQDELDDARAEYDREHASAMARLDDAAARLDSAKSELDDAAAALARNRAELDAAAAALDESRAELDAAKHGPAAGTAQLEAAERELDGQTAKLEAAYAELERGQASYESGLAEYEGGRTEYEGNRAQALRELDDAKAKIDEAQAEIDAIELPDLYILDRSKNTGTAGHEADANRIGQIARVFPLIFFLVAALVSLTTMTRMVDEERMLIGTHKALGYSNARICSKYLVYALIASGIGSLIGILVLSQFLPQVIMSSYAIIYALPVSVSPVDVPIALSAFGLSVGITLLATLFAVLSSLRERPALLMLPRAPKPGKRILLERVGPVWRHLSFSSKVTARNLFRYKRRFLMAIIGIAGCTALLLTGLGLRDGINDIIEKQFGEIQHFNLEVRSSDGQDVDDARIVDEVLAASGIVIDASRFGGGNSIVSSEDSDKDVRAAIVVPSDLETFDGFYTLRERVGHAPLSLDKTGAVITEKLASELDVGAGDIIEVYDQSAVGEREGSPHEVAVTGITEFYTGQRVFMSPEAYETAMGEPVSFTTVICKAEAPLDERTALSDELLDVEGVEVVSYYDEVIETYRTMLETVNAVVWVLIIAAALLAFVVLYNLTNINITERAREIATLKVLGFTPRETNNYIFRETVILTVIGALAGCILGIGMESFVVVTAEVDEMMFGRDIHAASFIIAFLLTIAFSILVSVAMRPKIKGIDMVESLKSVD